MAKGLKAEIEPRVLDRGLFTWSLSHQAEGGAGGELAYRLGPELSAEEPGVGGQGTMGSQRRGQRGLGPWTSAGLLLGRSFSLQDPLNELLGAVNSNTAGPDRHLSSWTRCDGCLVCRECHFSAPAH